MPSDSLFGISSLVSTLVASITVDITLLTMQQAVAFSDVGHVAREHGDQREPHHENDHLEAGQVSLALIQDLGQGQTLDRGEGSAG